MAQKGVYHDLYSLQFRAGEAPLGATIALE
jgi:hypothetical protein